MTSLQELYTRFLGESVWEDFFGPGGQQDGMQHLDCLFYPQKHGPAWRTTACGGGRPDSAAACLFDAIVRDAQGNLTLDPLRCADCESCRRACEEGSLLESRDILPALDAVKRAEGLVYVLIAPAFLGQFSPQVTPGRLRTAFKALGFDGMIEVALFADVLTLKEALEFEKNIVDERDFQLASCCCPMWIGMISKAYHELLPHVPGSVSPMIAAGRMVKRIHPDALTVFVGPCVAKKAEAKQPDVQGAVDYVLTFREVRDIFKAAGIRPEQMEESEKDHSSRAGRIYACAGGVSEAVKATVERLNPQRKIAIKTRRADGVPACREMIEALRRGERDANFFEGMGCVGGCVGGPMAIIDAAGAAANVAHYGEDAAYRTPLDNPYVFALLRRLGIHTVEQLLEEEDIFGRIFA